jgi:hypothetical protein
VMPAGTHSVPFQGKLKEGIYYLVLKHPAGTQVKRMVVVK